jgi:desulfoferrodoxin (superoxide reductase-like protein)
VIFSVGEALISCCGIQLPPIEVENDLGAENSDSIENLGEKDLFQNHKINVQNVEDEFFVSVNHPMEKEHYICWLAVVRLNSVEIIKLYPEQNAEARIKFGRRIKIFAYCNRHGLFEVKI